MLAQVRNTFNFIYGFRHSPHLVGIEEKMRSRTAKAIWRSLKRHYGTIKYVISLSILMNWDRFLSKSLLIAIAFGSATVTVSSASAATLFWDIQLFDETGTQVGEGEFSYDPDTTDTISFTNSTNPTGTQVTVNTLLDSYSVDLLGETIISEPFRDPWFELNSDDALQSIGVSTSGQQIQDIWQAPFATTIRGSANVLNLSGSSTDTTAEGVWDFDSNFPLLESNIEEGIVTDFPDSLRNTAISGNWNATLRGGTDSDSSDSGGDTPGSDVSQTTPESDSIVALLGLAGLGAMLTRKKRNS